MTVTVEAMGDLPFVSIESVQGLSGSTANMYWSVVDVDQTVDTQANVAVDGVVVDVNHSCLNSGAGAFQCDTLLPVPADSSTSFFIELEIYDAGLDRSVIANKVVDPSVIGTGQTKHQPVKTWRAPVPWLSSPASAQRWFLVEWLAS